MKSTFCLLTLATAMLVCPAFPQETQDCYGIGVYTTDDAHNKHYDATVCEFSDGRANVSTQDGDKYHSAWYTPEQWKKAKPGILADADKAVAELGARNEAAGKRMEEESAKRIAQIIAEAYEHDAREFKNKRSCEKTRNDFRNPGQKIAFVWRDGGCHASAK